MPGREVSVRELRNHTAQVVRRAQAGERLSLTVNGALWPISSPTILARRGRLRAW
ncbi:MAG: type II toxin-antitoxin system Phd/YefM family antitoxin [Solirubrobacteraceae bacterium]